ncbi:hypothetical protein C4573_02500 [Candidatus Woesearchaeota archaeon]|nr:MAG: hypothetical protein C4573_02500 [Candidatus Woesearchaeota archaeon]
MAPSKHRTSVKPRMTDKEMNHIAGTVNVLVHQSGLTLDTAVEQLCNAGNISKEELLGHRRYEPLVTWRQGFYYVCRTGLKMTWTSIAAQGNWHHATVMYGSNKIKDYVATLPSRAMQS